ncbi:MAG: EI24 domain-containing protein [Paracoccaceae bacterium]
MHRILVAFSRSIVSQLHPKMLALLIWPFLAAIVGWIVLAWFAWGPLVDWIADGLLGRFSMVQWTFDRVAAMGFSSAPDVVATVLALLVAILMIFATGMALVAVLAMPIVTRHLGERYPDVQRLVHGRSGRASECGVEHGDLRRGLPADHAPVAGAAARLRDPLVVVVSWLTARVMRFDSLVEHADPVERRALIASHRRSYLISGMLVTVLNYIPPLFLVTPVLSALAYVQASRSTCRAVRESRPE